MKVPSRQSKPSPKRKRVVNTSGVKKRNHPKYGTSKLEVYFEENFLKKLGVDYTYQYEAKEIGRYYDFALYPKGGGMILLEIDGSYFHSDPRVVDESKMSPMQKRNRRVDEYKNKWALLHGIPLMRIWEKDIRENPKMVMDELKKRLYIINEDTEKKNEKNKRHRNILL